MDVTIESPTVPVGKIKSFGPFGPKYEVGQPLRQLEDGDWIAGFTLTFRRDGHVLNSLSGNDVIPLLYEGLEGGKPTFFVPRLGAEISFAPNATGAMASMVLHQNGRDMVGIRQ